MRKITLILTVVSCMLASGSCSKESGVKKVGGDTYGQIEVNIGSRPTKVTGIADPSGRDGADESVINEVQVIAFDESGSCIAYEKSTSKSLIISCKAGNLDVYAIINHPESLEGVSTKAELLAKESLLKDNSGRNFVMAGHETASVPRDKSVTVNVERLAARIVVKKITADFGAELFRNLDFTIDGIYVTNVAGDNNFALNRKTYANWYNKAGYFYDPDPKDPAVEALTYDAVSGVNLKGGKSYETAHYFYVYPNANTSVAAPSGEEFTPRPTKLVLKTTLDGNVYFYPISLTDEKGIPYAIVSNKSYEISEIVITKRGNAQSGLHGVNPEDDVIDGEDLSIKVQVKEWDIVSLGTITI